MKKITSSIFVLLLSNFVFSQSALPTDTSKQFEEKVIKHFIDNGAYKHSYYHPEWRKNYDSAIVT